MVLDDYSNYTSAQLYDNTHKQQKVTGNIRQTFRIASAIISPTSCTNVHHISLTNEYSFDRCSETSAQSL